MADNVHIERIDSTIADLTTNLDPLQSAIATDNNSNGYKPYCWKDADGNLLQCAAVGEDAGFDSITALGDVELDGDLIFYGVGGGSNTLQTAVAQTADVTYTLPTAYPASTGLVLTCTDGGVMSWGAGSGVGSVTSPHIPYASAAGVLSDTNGHYASGVWTIEDATTAGMVISQTGNSDPALTIKSGRDTSENGTNSTIMFVNTAVASNSIAQISALLGPDTTNNDDGKLAFYTSETGGSPVQRMTIDSFGKIGVGTASPSYPLDLQAAQSEMQIKSTTSTNRADLLIVGGQTAVFGVESSAGGSLLNTGSLAYATVLGCTGNYALQFGTNNAVNMTILSSGNVGIGTTSPSNPLSVVKSTVGDVASFTNSGTTPRTAYIYTNEAIAAFGDVAAVGGAYRGITLDNAYGWLALATNGLNRVTVLDNGNVGIGTTSPGALLDVRGSAVFNEAGADVDFRIEGDTIASLFCVDASADRIGIGTGTPETILHVDGTLTATYIQSITFIDWNTGDTIFTLNSTSDLEMANTRRIRFSNDNATPLTLSSWSGCIPVKLSGGSVAYIPYTTSWA